MLERAKKIELPISLKNKLEDVAKAIKGSKPSLFKKSEQQKDIKSKFNREEDKESFESIRITNSSKLSSVSKKSLSIKMSKPTEKANTSKAPGVNFLGQVDFTALANKRIVEENKKSEGESKTGDTLSMKKGKSTTRSRRATILIQPHSQMEKTTSVPFHKRVATGTKVKKPDYNNLRRFSRGDSLPGFTKISSKTLSQLGTDLEKKSAKQANLELAELDKVEEKKDEQEEIKVVEGSPDAEPNANKFKKRVSRPISDRSDLNLIGSAKRRNTIAGLFLRGLGKNKEGTNIPSNPFMK